MLQGHKKQLPKDTYEVEFKQEAFYTGGDVQVTKDGTHLITTCRDRVKIVDMKTGLVINTIHQEDDPAVTCICLTPDDEHLVISNTNRLIRLWDWKNKFLIRSWKSIHIGPILEMAVDKTSTLLATGSSDMTIKLWDIDKKYWTHNLKGHKGIITALSFHPEELQLISASMDLLIKVWDLQTSQCVLNFEGHFSPITSVIIDSQNPHTLISAGRDNVLLVWDLNTQKRVDTVPVFEALESVIELPRIVNKAIGQKNAEDLHVVTAGSKGQLRVWNMKTRQCVFEQVLPESRGEKEPDSETGVYSITKAFMIPSIDSICTTNHEHNIMFYSIDDLSLDKQYIGNNEEILDIQLFGGNEEYLAIATNSSTVKVYSIENFDSDSLHGHTDIVLTLAVSSDGLLLLSGSKDNTAILWSIDDTGIHNMQKLYTAHGHSQHVSAVCFPKLKCHFFLTGGPDNTLKIWKSMTGGLADSPEHIHCAQTELAHDRDINCIDVSPNDKLIVTASRDKTAKIWKTDGLILVGILRGHKRGIWKARFSPIDQCVITASGDATVKIFSISDFSCIKTFEGHDCPVLNVSFVTRGMQFVSSDDSGLIKLWNIKDNELVKTFEGHTERCWALSCCKDTQNRMVSGGADATIIIWKDVTEEKVIRERKKQEKDMLQQQELSNLLHEKRYREALSLALTMEKPFNSLKIIREILKLESEEVLFETVSDLSMVQIDVLLRFAVEWNTNSKTCHEAQLVLNQVLRIHSPDELLDLPNIKPILEGLLPYSERHYQRMSKLVQQTQFVEYTWQCIRLSDQTPDLL